MPQQAPSCDRFILRLADGVRRTRLVEPIASAHPPFVVVNAPSGYGKSVLAAQIAASGAFDKTYWLDVRVCRAGISTAIKALAEQISPEAIDTRGWSEDELLRDCVARLGVLPSERAVLIVFDGMDDSSIAEALFLLGTVASETPIGSTVLMTTRSRVTDAALPSGSWLVDASMLRFDEAETADLWRISNGNRSSPGESAALAEMSGCHAALASLMARRAAMLGGVAQLSARDTLTGEIIRGLVDSQLDASQRRVLHTASLAGDGTAALLQVCIRQSGVGSMLARVAEVLPLVSCADVGGSHRFSVNRLVADALGGAKSLVDSDQEVVERLVHELAAAGRHVEALDIATESGLASLVVHALHEVGCQLIAGPNADRVRASIECLPAECLAGDPLLLTLVAESQWHGHQTSLALRTARLAASLAESLGDHGTALKAQLAAARFRWSMGEFEGILAEIGPLVSRWTTVEDLDDVGSLLTSASVAYALAADREGLAVCQTIAGGLRSCAGIRESTLVRMDEIDGLIAAILDGDYLDAFRKCVSCAACRHLSDPRRVSAFNNAASSALMAGLVEDAVATAVTGLGMAQPTRTEMTSSLESVIVLAGCLKGERLAAKPVLDRAIEAEMARGDRFGLAGDLMFSSLAILAFNERAAASSYSDRAVSAANETGSPVLIWLAELVQAMCSLAVDDVDRARSAARRILPEVESISAMGHVLHARMILAEIALRDEDLEQAVQHLSAISEHIIEKSPALVVACYLRTFPRLLGPLALAMGVDSIPTRVLNLLNGDYERAALDAASAVLTKKELDRLRGRMQSESNRVAARDQAAHEGPAVCEVRLLGGLHVTAPHGVVADRDWKKRKARLMFAMLVSRSGTDVSRGEIIEYLWPDMDEERGLNNFYVVWSAMKRALTPGSVGDKGSAFVEHTHGVCRVVPGRVVSDLDRFREALGRARSAHVAATPANELTALLEALELYRGDVLPGDVYDDWFGALRDRCKRDYEDTALRASRLYAAAGEPLEAMSLLRDASVRNPWREDLYQGILRLQIAEGQRAAAIETYFLCRSRLVEDLGIDPSRETTALYEQALGMEERVA